MIPNVLYIRSNVLTVQRLQVIVTHHCSATHIAKTNMLNIMCKPYYIFSARLLNDPATTTA